MKTTSANGLPKAEAARRKLSRINSEVAVEAVVDDVNHHNIAELAEGMDLLLDGTDNFETRFLINDLAVKTRPAVGLWGVRGSRPGCRCRSCRARRRVCGACSRTRPGRR